MLLPNQFTGTEIKHNMVVLRLLWPALNTYQVLATGHREEQFTDVSSGITVLSSGRINLGAKEVTTGFHGFYLLSHPTASHTLSLVIITCIFPEIFPSPLFITGKLLSR